jgi:RimJ/RimL family protein N-acetyltransferase
LRSSKSAEYLNCPEGYSLEMQLKWQESRTGDEVNYIIYDSVGVHKVGMVSIYDCNWVNGVSNVGRLLLHDSFVHKSTPYGLEALKLTYGYVFNKMNFRKISGTINSKNEKVYDLQRYLGMSEEGFFVDHVLLKGEPQSLYFLSLFKEDYPEYSAKIDLLLDKHRK